MHDVVWTDAAKADVEEICQYIAIHDSADRADRVASAFDDKVAQLAELPDRGNRPKELQDLGVLKYRELHWKPYRIVYGVVGKRVIVHCVLDGRRDMKTLLQERLLR